MGYIEKLLSTIFPYRHSAELSSRVRFKIQDLIDEYEKDWKAVIYGERKGVDEEGFQYKYVPKVVIKTEGGRSRKQSETYVYVPKTEKSKETLKQDHFMKSIIEGLKPTADLQVAGGEV